MKKLLILFCVLGVATSTNAQSGPDWEQFGDWEVAAVHDDMSPVSQIVMRSTVVPDEGESSRQPFLYGFRIFGRSLVTQDVPYGVGGRNYWPHCDLDYSTYKIGNARPEYIASVDEPGSCDKVSLSVIRKFRAASSAKVKIHYTTGTLSLAGFTAAWNRVQQLAYE